MSPPRAAPPPVAAVLEALLALATSPHAHAKPPIVDLDAPASSDTPLPASARNPPSDDDVTVVRDSRSAPLSQDDDEIEIVSAAFVTPSVRPRPTVDVDMDVAECHPAPLPHPPPPLNGPSVALDAASDAPPAFDVDAVPVSTEEPPPAFDVDAAPGVTAAAGVATPIIDVEAQPEPAASDDDAHDVIVCSAPPRRPRAPVRCHACDAAFRWHVPLRISRCKHALCARCALRAVAVVDDVPQVDDGGLVADALNPLPTCVVPRCRAPLARAEADLALVPPAVDDAFGMALAVFHSWRGEDADDAAMGPGVIEFPPFAADSMHAIVENGVVNGVECLLDDDLATACEPLWVLDEEAAGGSGAWICAACGQYDERVSCRDQGNVSSDGDRNSEPEDSVESRIIHSSPPFPHCEKARAIGVYETIKGLARVWEDEKDKKERQEEEEKAKQKTISASKVYGVRKTRAPRKRYKSASSVRSAKRQKTKKTGFAKGTGYAGSRGSEWKGPSEKFLNEAARLDAEATYWLVRLRSFLLPPKDAQLDSWPGYMRLLLRERRLIAHLAKVLVNESMMDVLGRIPVFYSALRVVHLLAETPSLRLLVTEPFDGSKGRSIAELVESLSRQAALLSTGAGSEGLQDSTAFLVKQIRKCIRVINRHNLLQVVRNRNASVCAVDVDKGEDDVQMEKEPDAAVELSANGEGQNTGEPARPQCFSFDHDKSTYIEKMKEHQFLAVPGLATRSVFYKEALRAEHNSAVQGKRNRRIASEVASLFSSLPLSWSSSILIRVDEDRYDFLKACIFGSDDTPYDSGAFIFDIFLPLEYPYVPPKFQLLTTGGGTVRFNPNLYSSGKVCLSLLGTWSGPSWTSASTILQVLVSIQSLILVSDPFFNEPGFESMVGTERGMVESGQYNARVRRDTARYAILGNITFLSPDFEQGLKAHFRLKRRYLKYRLRKWFPISPTQQPMASVTADSSQAGSGSFSGHVVTVDPTNQEGNPVSGNGTGQPHAPFGLPKVSTFGNGRNFRFSEMSPGMLERIFTELDNI